MKLAVVGVGGAGSRITNRILEVEKTSGRDLCSGNTLLINTVRTAFDTTEHVPEDRRMIVGDIHREVNGQGIDGDPDLGAEVAREDHHEIIRAFDLIDLYRVDGVLVVAGLGGGTGGGAGAVVIDELRKITDDPVYALAVLPSEAEGSERAMTAARSLRSFVEKADNVIVFDNEAWREDKPGEKKRDYSKTNVDIATRVVTLFAAGEIAGPTGAENRMDPSDIIRTLDTGGVSSIGYASTDVRPSRGGIRSWLPTLSLRGLWRSGKDGEEPPETDAAKINRLVRRAARSEMTLPCDISSADRALIQLSGPSNDLSRKGFESGRYWLEQETDTVEVLAGDEPHESSSKLTAAILLSNVTEVPRIDAMQEQGIAGEDEAEAAEKETASQ